MWPELHSGAHFYTLAIFAKIGPKTPKNNQDSSPTGLKMASQALSWAILAPSCRQVRPSCCHFGLPAPVQNRPKSAKTASWTFFFQRSPPRPPRPPPGLDFPGFGVDFSTFLARFFLGFCFPFLAFSMDFLRRLTEEAQLERKGPAVLAAGFFDVSK